MKIIFILLISKIILSASIIGSKHDLSATNYYGSGGSVATQVCVFCHTPHAGSPDVDGLLWNRGFSDTGAFVLYGGASGLPNTPTLVCLSCHDGISAYGASAVHGGMQHAMYNQPGSGHSTSSGTPNCNSCHASGGIYPGAEWTVGPNLTDDHPVSISYEDARLVAPDDFYLTPINGLRLYSGNVECTSCHDPHRVDTSYFLRMSNQNSDLCKSCHIK